MSRGHLEREIWEARFRLACSRIFRLFSSGWNRRLWFLKAFASTESRLRRHIEPCSTPGSTALLGIMAFYNWDESLLLLDFY